MGKEGGEIRVETGIEENLPSLGWLSHICLSKLLCARITWEAARL
jgi:hypothetical protein